MPHLFGIFHVKTITRSGYINYLLFVAYTFLYFVFIVIVYASIVLVLLIFYSICHPMGRAYIIRKTKYPSVS